MALQLLHYEFKVEAPKRIPIEWGHYGVTGSGDLEVLFERQDLNGAVRVKVATPVKGFEHVWKKVLERFVTEFNLGDLSIEINDDNATPVVVYLRLRQGLVETGFFKGEK